MGIKLLTTSFTTAPATLITSSTIAPTALMASFTIISVASTTSSIIALVVPMIIFIIKPIASIVFHSSALAALLLLVSFVIRSSVLPFVAFIEIALKLNVIIDLLLNLNHVVLLMHSQKTLNAAVALSASVVPSICCWCIIKKEYFAKKCTYAPNHCLLILVYTASFFILAVKLYVICFTIGTFIDIAKIPPHL